MAFKNRYWCFEWQKEICVFIFECDDMHSIVPKPASVFYKEKITFYIDVCSYY